MRLSADCLGVLECEVAVLLNRFDAAKDLHKWNLEWLHTRDGLSDVELPGGEIELARLVSG